MSYNKYGIDNPTGNPMFDLPFNMYAQHQSALDDFINLVKNSKDPNSPDVQYNALAMVGLTPDDLTPEDKAYLEEQLNK